MSKAAFWTDFLGGSFCMIQLQLDAMIAGYDSLFMDPQLNLAKSLIALFGIVNTSIILVQIHCLYKDLPRLQMVHEDSSIEGDKSMQSGANDISFQSFNGVLLI